MRAVLPEKKWLYVLLWMPVATYGLSYLYLAAYHHTWWLGRTVIHENGRLDLWGTLFYASHFLGHIPVLVIVALLFTGVYRCMSNHPPAMPALKYPAFLLAVFLGAALVISFACFGSKDTMTYILQQQQNPVTYVTGGSWNLHVPSTLVWYLFVPLYVYAGKWLWGKTLTWDGQGMRWVVFSLLSFIVMTAIFNRTWNIYEVIKNIGSDPRYLAHGVRELATFPLTLFPWPLYVFLRAEQAGPQLRDLRFGKGLSALGIALAAVVAYQIIVPLQAGIGQLAQKPDFARNGELGIGYLLASHYFEHFMDSVFFLLLCILLYGLKRKTERVAET